ncbi:MAG: hypothetical protein Aurels2KO_50310 [Aureliella sp.]
MNILLLEDDLVLAMHVREGLENEGWTVFHEVNARSAKVTLEEEQVDFVICDILIREVDNSISKEGGLTLIDFVKFNLTPCPPIFVITGASPKLNLVQLAEQMNVDRVFEKPVDIEDLVFEVRELLEAKR